MSFQDFTVLCQRHQMDRDETSTLGSLMNDLGQSIYYGADEGPHEFAVLNPEWLTKVIS
jgi:hypothetical protein